MAGPEEATILGRALDESPAHILCLDDDVPALSKLEAELIRNFRILPENDRKQYVDRITLFAQAYKIPVPGARMTESGYPQKKRPKAEAKSRSVKAGGKR